MRRLVILFIVFFSFGSAFAATPPGCGHNVCHQLYALQLTRAQLDGLAKVGHQMGSKVELVKLLVAAYQSGTAAVYISGTKLPLVIDNEGWNRKLYVADHTITGKYASGFVGGKYTKVFVPDRGEFLAAISPGIHQRQTFQKQNPNSKALKALDQARGLRWSGSDGSMSSKSLNIQKRRAALHCPLPTSAPAANRQKMIPSKPTIKVVPAENAYGWNQEYLDIPADVN